jgi:glucose-6-phosphate isomerase
MTHPTSSPAPSSTAPYRQSIAGCLSGAIGAHGLSESELGRWLEKCAPALHDLKADYASGRLPLLKIAEETPGAARGVEFAGRVVLL